MQGSFNHQGFTCRWRQEERDGVWVVVTRVRGIEVERQFPVKLSEAEAAQVALKLAESAESVQPEN